MSYSDLRDTPNCLELVDGLGCFAIVSSFFADRGLSNSSNSETNPCFENVD